MALNVPSPLGMETLHRILKLAQNSCIKLVLTPRYWCANTDQLLKLAVNAKLDNRLDCLKSSFACILSPVRVSLSGSFCQGCLRSSVALGFKLQVVDKFDAKVTAALSDAFSNSEVFFAMDKVKTEVSLGLYGNVVHCSLERSGDTLFFRPGYRIEVNNSASAERSRHITWLGK
jgi:hypothetical protein